MTYEFNPSCLEDTLSPYKPEPRIEKKDNDNISCDEEVLSLSQNLVDKTNQNKKDD